jgi:hypothetical protein
LFARHLRNGPLEDVGQAIREEIGTALNGKMSALGIHRPSELRETIKQATDLYERFRLFPAEGFEDAEVAVAFEPSQGVRLIGKVDAVFREEGGPILRDWKTGGLGEPFEQLMFYALVWALERGEMANGVEAVSLQTGERTRQAPTIAQLTVVAAQIAELVTLMRSAWAADRSENSVGNAVGVTVGDSVIYLSTERRGGPWCHYCPVLESCPEGQVANALNK